MYVGKAVDVTKCESAVISAETGQNLARGEVARLVEAAVSRPCSQCCEQM